MKPDAWIRPYRTHGEQIRLICFPYAGGGPQVFQKWVEWLPASVGLYAVHLPGRGTRMCDAPIDQLGPIVSALVDALRPMQYLPFAFFGHSMGALLAFETARALRHSGSAPRLLIVSGCRSPRLIEGREKMHNLSEESFIRKLAELGGTPAEVFQHKELLELLMPTLRADFAVIDSYNYTPTTPLNCPITALAGVQDDFAPASMMKEWQLETLGSFSMNRIQGQHFFIHDAEIEISSIVVRNIRDCFSVPESDFTSGLLRI
ncbi:MAG: thioesterase II family protein [Giesbergeria sp.]